MRRSALLAAAAAGLVLGCRLGTEARIPASTRFHLVVTPESLAFHGRAGDTILPDQYLSLGYDAAVFGGRWTATEDGSWFFLESSGDTLPFFLPVGPRPAGLPPGVYSAGIWVVGAGDTLHVPVTLQLDSATSLTGRWAAAQDSARVVLDLADSAGVVTGTGTMSPPAQPVAVAGMRSDTTVVLAITAGGTAYRFSGLLVDGRTLAGTLSGGGLSALPLTFYRQ